MMIFFAIVEGKMRRLKIPFMGLIFILSSFQLLLGQNHDFRTWWKAELSKELTKDINLSLNFNQRFKGNSLQNDRSLVTAELEYDFLKNFRVDGGFRYIYLKNKEMSMVSAYRVHSDLSYRFKISSFTFSFRERLQYGFDDLNSIDEYYLNKFTNRNKLKGDYDIFGSPLSLFASYELFLPLNRATPFLPSDHRFQTGIAYKISWKSALELSYLLDKELNDNNPSQYNILVVTFGYKL